MAKVEILGSVVTFALLVVIVVTGLLAPIGLYAVAPDRVANSLNSVVEWLKRNNRTISLVFFAFFGVLLLVRGFSSLFQ